MASVFLSYDREDSGRARSIAEALEEAGHSVWWDRHIRGGSQFSKEIEEALARAEAVVVLWSVHSVDSAWVRDEAAAGRDSGRLIPARIDRTQPPLGFRQFQTIDLSRWKSRTRSLSELLAAVESVGKPAIGRQSSPIIAKKPEISWRWVGTALAAIVLLAIGYFAWSRYSSGNAIASVSVTTSDSSGASRQLAEDLMIKLAKLQRARSDMRLLDSSSGEGSKSDLTFGVRDRSSGKTLAATLALMSSKDRSVLWSNDFEVEDGNRSNLQQQLSYAAARVLGCALEGLPANGPRLSEDLLRPYLNSCAVLGETYTYDVSQALPGFLLVTEKQPKFVPAWAKLLIAETDTYLSAPTDEVARLGNQLKIHIAQARKIDPNLSEAFLAEAELLPGDAFSKRAELIDKAIAYGPENVYVLSARAGFKQDIGQMASAVDDAHRAAQLDPLSPAMRNLHIASLAYAGRMPAAEAELAEAEKLWPGATTLIDARYRIHLRYGDPAEALRLQNIGAVPAGGSVRDSFLAARINRTPQNEQRAIATAWSIYGGSALAVGELIQTLGEFDREGELFPILIGWKNKSEIPFIADALFRPTLKELWFDPRFMQVAKSFGLLKYWTESGQWPDFCTDPELPYDCKTEAAKIAA